MSVNNDSYSLFFVLLIWMLVSFSIEPAFFLAVVALVSLFFFIKNRAAFAIDLPGSVVLLTLLMAVIGVVIGYFNGVFLYCLFFFLLHFLLKGCKLF